MRTIEKLMGYRQIVSEPILEEGSLDQYEIIGTISDSYGCLYYCFEYIGSKHGVSYSANDYSDDYVYGGLSEDDGWSGTQSLYDLNGPNPFVPDPDNPQSLAINPSIMDYMQRKFTVGSSLWTLKSQIQSTYFNESGSRTGSGDLLAVITPGGSKSHAVILQSYSGGKYTYYDPQNKCYSTVNAGSVAFGVEITNVK